MLVNPCSIAANSSNTGSECSDALKATAMIIMVPKRAFWAASDMTDFTAYIDTQIHAAAGSRWYPIFGDAAPVRGINDSNEADVIETMDDGSKQFIRRGYYNREFVTTEGGICLARHLFAFVGSNYAFIEIDIEGKVAMKANANGTFSGFPVALAYAPSPDLANLKTSYKNKFMISFSPRDYIGNGEVFASDSTEDILDLQGLLDTAVTKGTQTQTTTNIFVGVETVCGETDLAALYSGTGTGHIAQISNFIITAADGTTIITPSAAAMQNGEVKLTGAYTTATNITVKLAAPSVLKANGIEGYEGKVTATIPIP